MQDTEAVVVAQSKTGAVTAKVKPKSEVQIVSPAETESVIESRMQDIANILTGTGVSDPTMKECSKCKKEGRPSYHPIESFSTIKKTGKLSSQCKKCKSIAATAWCKSRAEHRKAYHKHYRTLRKEGGSNALRILNGTPEVPEADIPEGFRGRKQLEALYAAFNGTNVNLVLGD